MLQDPDREKADRVMQAMLQMKEIDIARVRQAYIRPVVDCQNPTSQ